MENKMNDTYGKAPREVSNTKEACPIVNILGTTGSTSNYI
jgi:hypothetical protein